MSMDAEDVSALVVEEGRIVIFKKILFLIFISIFLFLICNISSEVGFIGFLFLSMLFPHVFLISSLSLSNSSIINACPYFLNHFSANFEIPETRPYAASMSSGSLKQSGSQQKLHRQLGVSGEELSFLSENQKVLKFFGEAPPPSSFRRRT